MEWEGELPLDMIYELQGRRDIIVKSSSYTFCLHFNLYESSIMNVFQQDALSVNIWIDFLCCGWDKVKRGLVPHGMRGKLGVFIEMRIKWADIIKSKRGSGGNGVLRFRVFICEIKRWNEIENFLTELSNCLYFV